MRVIRYAIGIVDAFLGLDFVLRAIASNPAGGFVGFIERVAAVLAAPLIGVIRVGSSYHWVDVVAIVVYTIAAWLVLRLVGTGIRRRSLFAR